MARLKAIHSDFFLAPAISGDTITRRGGAVEHNTGGNPSGQQRAESFAHEHA